MKIQTPERNRKINRDSVKKNEDKTQETVLEIDLAALEKNYHYLTSKIDDKTKFLAVVKAFAYGSDAVAVAKKLEELGVDYLAVAYTGEGVTLKKAGITTPILVLHSLPVNYDEIIENDLELSLYSPKVLLDFVEYAESKKIKDYPVHLKFNTGLNRLGFEREEVDFVLKTLSKTKSIRVRSFFSHLAASEDRNLRDFMLKQIEIFKEISEKLLKGLDYKPLLHCSNTSGIVNFPEAHFDMVRSGIGLYGYGNSLEVNKRLTPIGTLKTVISQIHQIKEGDSVGYNMGFIAPRATRSATLPIGHADGISRAYGKGKGWAMINGRKAPFIGNICMDMLMVDVTDIVCEEGDEAIIFGTDSTAEELSAAIHSIPYELITSVSQRIKRKILNK